MSHDILDEARSRVLHEGRGLDQDQVARCLSLPEDRLGEALSLAHEVRMRWCGPEVEVEGIVSVKTGGCPEDCHFCSQSGQFSSPVRAVWLDIPDWSRPPGRRRPPGPPSSASWPRCAGPDGRLMSQVPPRSGRSRDEIDIHVACSLGILTPAQVGRAGRLRRAPLQPQPGDRAVLLRQVVTTHTWEERWAHLRMVQGGHGAVLRRHHRHGRELGSAPSSPRSSPASARTRCR